MRFIYTQDKEIRDKLIASGYKQIKEYYGNMYVFENSPTLTFSKEELPKVAYSNIMFI